MRCTDAASDSVPLALHSRHANPGCSRAAGDVLRMLVPPDFRVVQYFVELCYVVIPWGGPPHRLL
jgi:hypothetical protein